jgi:hypothetical protein
MVVVVVVLFIINVESHAADSSKNSPFWRWRRDNMISWFNNHQSMAYSYMWLSTNISYHLNKYVNLANTIFHLILISIKCLQFVEKNNQKTKKKCPSIEMK